MEASTASPAPIRYRPGDRIPQEGVYRAVHSPDTSHHFLVLREGHVFPRCQGCRDAVRFESVPISTPIDRQSLFHSVHLYEIPHPADEEQLRATG